MSEIKINEFTYQVNNDSIKAKDWFIFNNPTPNSSMKNKVIQCAVVYHTGEIQPLEKHSLVGKKYPAAWCKS